MKNSINLINKTFGRLKVVALSKNNSFKWVCKCKCGNTVEVYQSHLLRGEIVSCGCKQKENHKNLLNMKDIAYIKRVQSKKLSKNNTSGVKGVSFYPRRDKWIADICVNNKKMRLGYFDKKEDAIKARINAEIKYSRRKDEN